MFKRFLNNIQIDETISRQVQTKIKQFLKLDKQCLNKSVFQKSDETIFEQVQTKIKQLLKLDEQSLNKSVFQKSDETMFKQNETIFQASW